MSSTQAAVVLGASGSVGNALIKRLIGNGSFKTIVTLVRRSQPGQVAMALDAGVELRETLVPAMDSAELEAATTNAIRSLEGDVVGLSVLGVGAGKVPFDHRRADRKGDGRDLTERADEIGRVPLPRNGGVEPVIVGVF